MAGNDIVLLRAIVSCPDLHDSKELDPNTVRRMPGCGPIAVAPQSGGYDFPVNPRTSNPRPGRSSGTRPARPPSLI